MTQTFVIDGKPTPLARGRFAHNHVYDAQKEEKHQFKQELLYQRECPPYSGPISLEVTFYMPVPSSSTIKERKELPGTHHHRRPDLDNLIKFVLDCGNEIIFEDDALISVIVAKKIYGAKPRTEITITEVQL